MDNIETIFRTFERLVQYCLHNQRYYFIVAQSCTLMLWISLEAKQKISYLYFTSFIWLYNRSLMNYNWDTITRDLGKHAVEKIPVLRKVVERKMIRFWFQHFQHSWQPWRHVKPILRCCLFTVLKIRTIHHARDWWKLAWSVAFTMPVRPMKFASYCFTQWISKLLGSFEIHCVRQYLVNVVLIRTNDLQTSEAIWWICCIFAVNMFCVYYVIWTESLGVSGRAGANHNAQCDQSFCFFFSECCLCISANLILYFMYVNQKLSCKMGSNKVFLNLNLKIWNVCKAQN